jgi:hypothetical protein
VLESCPAAMVPLILMIAAETVHSIAYGIFLLLYVGYP